MSAPDLTQMSIYGTSNPASGTSTEASVSLSSSATDENCLGIAYKSAASAGLTVSLFNGGIHTGATSRKSPAGKLPKGRHTGLRSSGSGSHFSRSGSGGVGGGGGVKKSHSMMDLVNYEKYTEDDMLAGELSCRE